MQHSGAWTTNPRVARPERPEDVLAGLRQRGQKELPSRYLYDALGSALFEAITLLPEYGLTRADSRLIAAHAGEIREHGHPSLVVELGSGGGAKAKGILDVLAHQHPVRYCPVDISPTALAACRLAFVESPQIQVRAIEDSYSEGLRSALSGRAEGQTALVLFLGSTIGNFNPQEAAELCRDIRQQLKRGDLFLLSADLEKDEPRMLAAYDDSLGVTAAFNRNVLTHLNRELGTNFDLSRFVHVVRYDKELHRIEMHVLSTVDQVVSTGGGQIVTLRVGETIRTECSYKFRLPDLRRLCEGAGFHLETHWIDWEWPFAQTLLRVL